MKKRFLPILLALCLLLPLGVGGLTAQATDMPTQGVLDVSTDAPKKASSPAPQGFAAVQAQSTADEYRFVLTWGADPRDLDSHITGVNGAGQTFHVYYSDMYGAGAWLDHDDVDGYGPETVTTVDSALWDYTYYVDLFAGEGTIQDSGAQIQVYKGSQLIQTIKASDAVSDGRTGKYWTVFTLKDGFLNIINSISDKVDIYDPSQGYSYDDAWFSASSSQYNSDLALFAAELSNVAYAGENAMRAQLNPLGFDEITYCHYGETNTKDNPKDIVAFTLARKQVGTQWIVAIVVRGTIGAEWYSNFKVAHDNGSNGFVLGDYHYGFNSAKQDLMQRLHTFLGTNFNYGNASFFITGHSRGAAVANLVAADLTGNWSSRGAQKSKVFAYTFATPNVSKASGVMDFNKYSNIFNIVNSEDMVPVLPLKKWGFYKYGKTLLLNRGDKPTSTAGAYFRADTGKTYLPFNDGGAATIQFAFDLEKIAPTVSDYYTKLESVNVAPGPRLTPYGFMMKVAARQAGDDNSTDFIVGRLTLTTFAPTARFFAWYTGGVQIPNDWWLIGGVGHGEDNIADAHKMETYIAWLKVYGSAAQNNCASDNNFQGRIVEVHCPVDFEVYDSGNQLVGRVVNNEVDYSCLRGIAISIDGDQKNLVLPDNQNYTFKMSGTGNGTMDFVVHDFNRGTFETSNTKSFINVPITPNKKLTSTVSGSISTPNVRLFVTDDQGNIISEVNANGPDGAKEYFKLWGKTTRWEKTFLNWILLIVCFGWIWMAF